MNKILENKQKILNDAVEYYVNNKDAGLYATSRLFNLCATTLTSELKRRNIQIRNSFHRKEAALDIALNKLNENNIKQISEEYGICEDILLRYLNGVKSQVKKYAIECAVNEYKNASKFDKNIKGIANKYGINEKTLKHYLVENKIPIQSTTPGLHVKEDAFSVIDTEEKAYWLGFLYADGFISAKGNTFGLSLSIKDIDHMKKFNTFLEYNGGLSVCETHQFGSKEHINQNGEVLYTVSTRISNKLIWSDLNEKGCVPNKSLILKFPDTKIFNDDRNLILAFIRGYFDGDGTLGCYLRKRDNKYEESLMFVGTKPFLMEVQKYLGPGFLMQKKNCNILVHRLSYSTRKANKAAELMYTNATIYLDRKYNIYKNQYLPRQSGKNGEG